MQILIIMILYLNSLKKMGGGVNDSGIVYKTKIYLNKNFIIDKLLDITDECNIYVNDNCVLKVDNNGILIIGFNVGNICALNIIKGGTLNINGGTLNINSGNFLINYGTLTIDDGKLNNFTNGYINNNGNLDINGGTLRFEARSTLNNNGNLNIKGGTLNFNSYITLNNNGGNILFTKGSINATKDLEMYMVDKNFQGRTILKTYDSVLSSFGVNETLDGYLIDGTQSTDSKTEYTELLKKRLLSLLDSRLTINTKVINWVEQTIEDYKNMRTIEETQKVNDKELETYNSVLSSFGVNRTTVESKDDYNKKLYDQFKDLLNSKLTNIKTSKINWPEIAITDEISKLNDEITGLKEEIERLKNNQEDNEDIDLNNLKEKINLLENNLSIIDTKIQKLILLSLLNVKNI